MKYFLLKYFLTTYQENKTMTRSRISIRDIRENAMRAKKEKAMVEVVEEVNPKSKKTESVFIHNNTTEIFYTIENGIMYRSSKTNDIMSSSSLMVGREQFYEYLQRIWNHIQSVCDSGNAKIRCRLFLYEVRHNELNQLSAKSRCFANIILDSFAVENNIQRERVIEFNQPKSRIYILREKIMYYICPVRLSV